MKKLLCTILALLTLLTALPAGAETTMDNPIPQEILSLFDVPAWDNYYIPMVTMSPTYYAFAKTDEIDGYCAGLIILRKESEQRNVLCLLEKKNGKWRITARNHEALPRGEEGTISWRCTGAAMMPKLLVACISPRRTKVGF